MLGDERVHRRLETRYPTWENIAFSEADQVFDQRFAHAVDDPGVGYTRSDLADHIRTEYSTFRWLFEPMLAAAGFEIATAEFDGPVYGAYTSVKR